MAGSCAVCQRGGSGPCYDEDVSEPKRKRTEPRRLADLVETQIEAVGPPPVPLAVSRVWAEVVGERVARRTRPVRLKRGTLLVQVSSNAWMLELQMLSPVILSA